MACTEIENLIDKFNTFTEKPAKFLTAQKEIKNDVKKFVKSLYDYTKSQEKSEKKKKKDALKELIVEDFDEEQIWQQIELQNSERWEQLVWEVANCMSSKNNLMFPVKTSEEQQSDENYPEADDSISEDDQIMSENENLLSETEATETQKKKPLPKSKAKSSIVDDHFFKLNEMEQFLLKEERKEGKKKADSDSDNESVDYFEEMDDDDEEEGERDMMYSDFFDQSEGQENGVQDDHDNENGNVSEEEIDENEEEEAQKSKKKVRFAQPSSDEESDNDSDDDKPKDIETSNEKKSEFELRQQRLKQQIERLEERTLKEAPWQLKGEVDATKRPQNSLLQEVVDFDLTTRPAPIITEQTTVTLEDLIRQRIKDKAWDDVEKKEKPVDDQLVFRKKEVLDHAKSKLSLAQVYEAEYLKQKQALSGDVEDEKEPESHKEIREAMSQLFSKLDALCHYHYTPKPAQAEVKIVTNTPAISMEEVAPVATSDAALLAPEEVKKKHRGELMSKEERSKTDKNRERRKKKKLQREKGKVVNVTEQRNTKKSMEVSENKSVKTSKAFFQQLNDDSNSLIKKKNKNNVKRQ